MAYEPAPLITSESPRRRRSRRRRQQQSTCCCLVIVLASMALVIVAWRGRIGNLFRGRGTPAPAAKTAFPLELTTPREAYLRYELVPLQATLRDASGQPIATATPPDVTVTRGGEVVTTVGGVERVTLRYDRNSQTYLALWPVPWNAEPGQYVAEARVSISDPQAWLWETPEQRREREREERRRRQKPKPVEIKGESYCVARARFEVQGRARADIPKGTCIATWEPDFRAAQIPRPTGGRGDWKAMLDWCQYMGADTFWFRGAVTEAYQGELTDEMPFNPANLRAIPEMAAEAHRRGLKFGAWAAAYSTYPRGSNARKPGYQWAKDISRSTGAIRDLDFISLLEPKRVDHLAAFVAQMQSDPNVDYVGLDYMRSDRGGYEMVDRFTSEMPLRLPAGFSGWSQTRRWAYVAGKIEKEWQTDPRFYDAWNWWRAHLGAGIVRSIIERAELKKPLWIFVLSWWHGKQHGQDPIMFTDAGTALLCPMLYQVPNRAHFDQMVKDWGAYVREGQVNLAPGDQVDFYWHQNTLRPAAPEELYDRIMTAHRGYLANDLTVGAFWHDVSRAALGSNKGPYPGTEWALAGGAAFTAIRNNWRVHPLIATLKTPGGAPLGGAFQAEITLQNIVRVPVKRIQVKLASTEGVTAVSGLPQTIPSLGGGQTLTVPVSLRLVGPDGSRANRFMVACFVTWPDGDYGDAVRRDLPRQQIVMRYVQGR